MNSREELADKIDVYGGYQPTSDEWDVIRNALRAGHAQSPLEAVQEELRTAYRAAHDRLGEMQDDKSIDAVSRNWQGGKVNGLGDARDILRKHLALRRHLAALTSTVSQDVEKTEDGAS